MQTSCKGLLTDCILHTEQGATALKTAGEAKHPALQIAMIVKGVPQTFNAFSALTSHVIEFADGTRCPGGLKGSF